MQGSSRSGAVEEQRKFTPTAQGADVSDLVAPVGQAAIPASGERDYLTGIANRAHFAKVLERRLREMENGTEGGVCVVYLDLDRFKQVNDTLGHAVGDDLLKLVSTRLEGEISSKDTLARLGGDEFAMVLTQLSEREELSHFAQRLIDLVQRTYLIEGHIVHVGASVGIASAPQHGTASKDLLRRSDLALYAAKHAGRGTYRFFTPELEVMAEDRRNTEADLRKALALRQMVMFYQPQLNLDTGRMAEIKAQMCWRHPKRGLVPASDFMPLAEDIGVAIPIGEWMLRNVCGEAGKWPRGPVFAIGVSAHQFESAGFVASVTSALTRADVSGDRLEIEITEELLLRNNTSVPDTLRALRQQGVLVTLNNFGTGVASLSQLARLTFDRSKIDRSLVDLQQNDPKNMVIVRAISALGESLGVVTHAQGIESREHLEKVRSEGCRTVQGFSCGATVPADQLAVLLGREA